MKKALIITYHFPPEGGAGVQRVVKFVKYLPEFGYEPFVLTTKQKAKLNDFSLIKEIEGNYVYRIPNLGDRIPYDLKNIFSSYLQPDKKILWKYTATKKAVDIVKKDSIDLIMSTSPPHSVHLIAKEIAEKCQLPWVADFRDEWTTDNLTCRKYFVKNEGLEKEIITSADYITTVRHSAKKHFQTFNDRVRVIYNGFDPNDFTNLNGIYTKDTFTNNKFNILYTGSFTPRSSPIKLFDKLEEIISDDEGVRRDFNLTVIGDKKSNMRRLKNYPKLLEHVNIIGYRQHDYCLKLMGEADVLLLLATNEKGMDVLPGKLFEYFYSQKPIFAVESYESELDVLLKEYGNYYLAREEEENLIKETFYQVYNDWKQRKLSDSQNNSFIEEFDRKYLTGKLAEVFDTLTD
jgi:glycosyltransferase involved in cell wall biosynthesis